MFLIPVTTVTSPWKKTTAAPHWLSETTRSWRLIDSNESSWFSRSRTAPRRAFIFCPSICALCQMPSLGWLPMEGLEKSWRVSRAETAPLIIGARCVGKAPNRAALQFWGFTLWLCQNSYWRWPFLVDFPINNGDFPSFFVNVYQRVRIVWMKNWVWVKSLGIKIGWLIHRNIPIEWPSLMCKTPWVYIWVCLKIGYFPNYSHLIGIMIINHWV